MYDKFVIRLSVSMIGKLSRAQCHTGTQPAASPRYDTSRTITYHIIPPLNQITNTDSFLVLVLFESYIGLMY